MSLRNEKRVNAEDPHGGRFSRPRRAFRPSRPFQSKQPMSTYNLQLLQNKDPLEVALTLKSEKSGFRLLICQENLTGPTIQLILKVLDLACSSQRKENLSETLKMVSEVPLFMNQLKRFFNDMNNNCSIEVMSIGHLLTFLETLIAAYPIVSRTTVEGFLLTLEKVARIGPDGDSFLKKRIQLLSSKLQCAVPVVSHNEYSSSSFRKMSVFPGEEDFEPDLYLKPNLLKGSYSSVESYLDVQFRLFREDYVRPLRESIVSYRKQVSEGVASNFKDIRVYRNVRLSEALLTVDDGVVHKISFKYDGSIQWETSKRLIFGSLICLSVNCFKTMLVATVVASKPCELRQGLVYIRFSEEHVNEAHKLKDRTFVAIETDAYFEAYRHVLSVLQEFEPERFPMKEYIVGVKNEPKWPRYLSLDKSYCFRGILEPSISNLIEELTYKIKNLWALTPDGKPCDVDVKCSCSNSHLHMPYPVSELQNWPDEERFHLDKSQLAAFKSALTSKLCLIQGPPGTGKTHVGLKIVHALLHNQLYQSSALLTSPILVVCYTNHALDQFLEGVLKITEKVVRVGGRSTSEALADHNLKHLKMTSFNDFTRSYRGAVRATLERFIEDIETLQLLREDARVRLLSENEIQEDIFKHHMLSLMNDHPACMSLSQESFGSFIHYWLGSQIPESFYYTVDGQNYIWMDDFERMEEMVRMLEDMEYSEFLFNIFLRPQISNETKSNFCPLLVLDQANLGDRNTCSKRLLNVADLGDVADVDFIRAQRMEEDDVLKDAKVIYGTNERTTKLSNPMQRSFVSKQLKCTPLDESDAAKCSNVWELRLPDRWRLYKLWLVNFYSRSKERIETLKQEYNKELKLYDELRQERERLVTTGYDLVGMTTTGAAKYKHLMRGLKPKVVIVEEAAEVQEAHIISSLSENTQHLILIGDHQQLRPNPACYELAKNYGLDVSLFERLVSNGLPYCRLSVQHRMRPSISQLLVPHIYASLEDHSSVYEYEDVGGMDQNVFFLSHCFPEEQSNTSKCNYFEAEYLVMLCKHLVLQGYSPEQITILSTYLAQFALIKHFASNVPLINGTKITVVDNYQGEENDIVLVSFVRSNERGSIGFLKTDNRVCVALSRAKKGLYCVGNFELLFRESTLWKNIVSKLREMKAIGSTLMTKCQNHNTTFAVSVAKDFDNIPGGGCTLPCDFRLSCGHTCIRRCHPLDPEHKNYQCTLPCLRTNPSCEYGHACTRPCWSDCGPCMFRVKKVLTPCLHEDLVPCSVDLDVVSCRVPCPEMLACGHKCSSVCGRPCPDCSVLVSTLSPCGHNVVVPCNMSDSELELLSACREPCSKTLSCGHACPAYCCSECVRHCMAPQEKQLSCGHLCTVPCYRKQESDHELLKTCSAACNFLLACGHMCKGTCGKCAQGRFHIPCRQRCEKELLCGHFIENAVCCQAIPSCRFSCRNECSHRRCIFPCSCACRPCVSRCSWNCEHHQCSRLCEEPCDRPVCDLPCLKSLPCGHGCLGYCGETCPPKCLICDEDNLVDLRLHGDDVNKDGRHPRKLILLESCGHVFDCKDLERWLQHQCLTDSNLFRKIRSPSCPVCKVPIRRSGRLGKFVRDARKSVGTVKRLMFGSELQNEQKRAMLLKRIAALNLPSLQIPRLKNVESVLLRQLKSRISKGKQPQHVLMGVEICLRICEELSSISYSLVKASSLDTATRNVVHEKVTFLANEIIPNSKNITQQLLDDTKGELNRLWSVLDENNLQIGKPCSPESGKESLTSSESSRRFGLYGIRDFLVGNWYVCSNGHACCFHHHMENFFCDQC